MIKFILYLSILFSLFPQNVYPDVIILDTSYHHDLEYALKNTKVGDIIKLPSGGWKIHETLEIPEGVSLIGSDDKNNPTYLINNINDSESMLEIRAKVGRAFKIQNIIFLGKGYNLQQIDPDGNFLDSAITIYGGAKNFIIENNQFIGFSDSGIKLHPHIGARDYHPVGVIANNRFKNIFFHNHQTSRGYGVSVYGNIKWPKLQLGTEYTVFIEDNYFYGVRHSVVGNFGSRYVFRHNTVVNTHEFSAVDTHGQKLASYGARSFEVYKNEIFMERNINNTWAVGIRGGDGLIYDNTFNNMTDPIFIVAENFDNLSDKTYPIRDQTKQLWIWANKHNGINVGELKIGWSPLITEQQSYLFQEGRDYYFHKKSNYTPYPYPHPLRNLILSLNFNDVGRSVPLYDNSGSGINLDVHGVKYDNSRLTQSAIFDGSNDYINYSHHNELNVSDEISISMWVKPDAGISNNQPQRTIANNYQWRPGGTGRGWFLGTGWLSNDLVFTIYNGQGKHAYVSVKDFFTDNVGLNIWSHIVCVYKPNSYMKIYIDGLLHAETTTNIPDSIPYFIDSRIILGMRGDGNYYFSGKMDDFRIFSKALNKIEVSNNYNLVEDGSFENRSSNDELRNAWNILSGFPSLDNVENIDGEYSFKFYKPTSNSTERSISSYRYIPVTGGNQYRLSAFAKGINISQGVIPWHRFSLIARWYDADMKMLSSADLNLPSGTYQWQKFDVVREAPIQARYFKITSIGIHRSASGLGWIDKVHFSEN